MSDPMTADPLRPVLALFAAVSAAHHLSLIHI